MSDPITTSRSAREALARGLNALQADPSVPPHLVDLAAPIAQAMGALHQIERTGQVAPHADTALGHVRGALSKLQSQPAAHPAVAAALEAVAASLGFVHSLSKMAAGPAAAPPQQHAAPPQAAPQNVAQAGLGHQATVAAINQTANMPPQGAFPQGQGYGQPVVAQAPVGGTQNMVARDPFAAAPAPTGKPATPSMPVPAPPAQGNAPVINADLGAHSPTNFYKGLAGNDIIDHGGLFVSTYVPPKVGTPVRLKVSLPGGYEFEANAIVKWTREQGGDAPPGFGAQFTGITNEARQLVYRYVRNREPIFYDDL